MVLESIKLTEGENGALSLQILDQRLLPHEVQYIEIKNENDAVHAIKTMQVRGAPAIAMVGALSIAVLIRDGGFVRDAGRDAEPAVFVSWVREKLQTLVASRPTAVNLARAAADLDKVVSNAASLTDDYRDCEDAYAQAALIMLEHDRSDNKGIGEHGAGWIVENAEAARRGPVSMLTHCNTGSLATAGYGTALGVIRSLHSHGMLKHAFCTETRPYNQGSRLTAFELVHDKIPASLITDSMAGALMRLKGEKENIAAVVVGADRVAANGDTANKIGTYSLAIMAKYHGIKFIVAAPRTTIDMATPSGELIKIEERASHEMTTIRGPVVADGKVDSLRSAETLSIAAPGIDVWNPAFDVTPRELVDAIVTEVGVAEKNVGGNFDLQRLMDLPRAEEASNGHA